MSEDLIRYGKAQKIVNMTFKYLYLFPDGDEYKATIFDKCHMAIDSYILEYFGKRVCKDKKKLFTSTSWSKLGLDEYTNIQTAIKDWLNDTDNRNEIEKEYKDIKCKKENINFKNLDMPFFAEFYIWEIAKSKQQNNNGGIIP